MDTDAVPVDPVEVRAKRTRAHHDATYEGFYSRKADAPPVGRNRVLGPEHVKWQDGTRVRDLEGVEVYVSPYQAPLDFRGPGGLEGGCGIVAIWPARGEDTPADVADATAAPAPDRGEDDRWVSSLATLGVLAGLTTLLHVLFRKRHGHDEEGDDHGPTTVQGEERSLPEWGLGDRLTTIHAEGEGDAPHFEQVWDAAFLGERGVVVVDGMARSLYLFDPEGEYRETFGGPGEGSGEFQIVEAVDVLPGDTLVSYDRGQRRVQRFHPGEGLVDVTGLRGSETHAAPLNLGGGRWAGRAARTHPRRRGRGNAGRFARPAGPHGSPRPGRG